MIKIKVLPNATTLQKVQLQACLDALNGIWSSDAFHNEILTCMFNGKKGFASTQDSPEMVWGVLQGGDVVIPSISFYRPSWWQRMKSRFGGWAVVGAENPDKSIVINADIFETATLADRAANIAHEATHVCGYSHDYNPTAERPFSVPYQIETIVENLLGAPQ